MNPSISELIEYRLIRAKETFDDAEILRVNGKWNSAVNRLYYAAFYAISALLLANEISPTTHNGVKTNFSEKFIKTGLLDKKYGRIFSQLFTWRQKGDYADLFDFDQEKVNPYFTPVNELIAVIETHLRNK